MADENKAGSAHKRMEDSEKKYRAPALEKGLEVLKLLATSSRELKFPEITAALSRSQSELFRIVHVLAQQGYIERSRTGAYRITNQLFRLGMERPPIRDLTATASPIMRALAKRVGQSCHLAIQSQDQIVVIYRIEPPGELGFSVRVGYRRSIGATTSGLVLFAFQPDDVREEILETIRAMEPDFADGDFITAANKVASDGFATEPSKFVKGIADLSCPIIEGGHAIAALTIPFVDSQMKLSTKKETLDHLKTASALISETLLMPETDPSVEFVELAD